MALVAAFLSHRLGCMGIPGIFHRSFEDCPRSFRRASPDGDRIGCCLPASVTDDDRFNAWVCVHALCLESRPEWRAVQTRAAFRRIHLSSLYRAPQHLSAVRAGRASVLQEAIFPDMNCHALSLTPRAAHSNHSEVSLATMAATTHASSELHEAALLHRSLGTAWDTTTAEAHAKHPGSKRIVS